MTWIRIFFLPFALAACGESSETDLAIATDYETPASAASHLPIALPSPPAPDHNYNDREGWTYFYIAAVTEEERKSGRATGSVSAFQYLGANSDGEHILASINDNGTVAFKAKCEVSCRIIDTDYGRKIAFSPDSVIGGAFQDAFRGKLAVAEWAKDEIVAETRSPAPAPPPSPIAQVPAPLTDSESDGETILPVSTEVGDLSE